MFRKLLVIFASFVCLNAEIIEIQTTQNLLPQLQQDGNVVFFGIDETLLTSDYYAGQSSFRHFVLDQAKEYEAKYGNPFGYDIGQYLVGILKEKIPAVAVEYTTPKLIAILQAYKVPVFALTGRRQMYPLKPGEFLDRKALTIAQLQAIGVKMDEIFFTNLAFKGDAVLDVLQKKQLTPKKVIMIDDKLEELESIEKTLANTSIAFTGYLYHFPKKKIDNNALGMIQLNSLILQGTLPTNKEVEQMMYIEPWIMFEQLLNAMR